jgi:hypothetical protein
MSAWSWGQPDAVRVVLIARGTDGEELHWLGDLRGGRDKGKTIRLPSGTETVTIARPQHASVPLSSVHRDRWFPARPSHASSLGPTPLRRLGTLLAELSARRLVRRAWRRDGGDAR